MDVEQGEGGLLHSDGGASFGLHAYNKIIKLGKYR